MVTTLSAGLCRLALALAPVAAEAEPLPFDPPAWARSAQVAVKVAERGSEVVYEGVPLRVVLEGKLGDGGMASMRTLADSVLIVRAADGYQAAFSAAEVAMDRKGERYVLATRRDGRPMVAPQGPVRLIAPGDPEHVRWVRMVTAVELVRFPRSAARPDR